MSRLRTAAAVALAAASVATTSAAAPASSDPAAADAALVKAFVAFDRDVTDADLAALTSLGVASGFEVESIDAVAVTAPASVLEAARELRGVRAVQRQRRLELHLFASVNQVNARGVEVAEDYELDGATVTRPGVTGAGVTVGIIDTGIFVHPDFGDRVVAGLNFEFSELQDEGLLTTEQLDAYAEATGDSAFVDEIGHGTHVAGTVAGDGSAAQGDHDLRGVAPEANLVALRIASGVNGLLDDIGFEENAVAAMDYLIRHPELGVTITNNSWGLLETEPSTIPGEETDFDAAAEVTRDAVEAGMTMVFSAGNDGPDFGTIGDDPGGIEEVITVAAACKDAPSGCEAPGITDFSSRGAEDGTGPQVDIAAPGDQILAAASPSVIAGLNQCPESAEPGYYCISGTSMAAPHIAGVVALMQQANPELTPAQAEECITSTATDMLEPGWDVHSGAGMVETRGALECAHALTVTTSTPAGETTPAGDDDTVAAPASESSLPATGGGAVALAALSLLGAAGLRRRG